MSNRLQSQSHQTFSWIILSPQVPTNVMTRTQKNYLSQHMSLLQRQSFHFPPIYLKTFLHLDFPQPHIVKHHHYCPTPYHMATPTYSLIRAYPWARTRPPLHSPATLPLTRLHQPKILSPTPQQNVSLSNKPPLLQQKWKLDKNNLVCHSSPVNSLPGQPSPTPITTYPTSANTSPNPNQSHLRIPPATNTHQHKPVQN